MAKSNRGDGRRGNGRNISKTRLGMPPSERGRTVNPAGVPERDIGIGVTSPPLAGEGTIQLLTDADETEFQSLVRRQLELLGEDPDREGLQRTPTRVAKSLAWLTRGYRQDAHSAVGEGVFAEAHDHMVMVRDIEL